MVKDVFIENDNLVVFLMGKKYVFSLDKIRKNYALKQACREFYKDYQKNLKSIESQYKEFTR